MAATLEKNAEIEVVSKQIVEGIRKHLGHLTREAVEDLIQLAELLRNEENESEKKEIAKTLMELICPESVRLQVIKEDRLQEALAARKKLDAYRQKVGEQVKLLREALGFTQVQLAELTDLPQSHISRIEKGQHAPTFTTMERLAKALNTTPDQLDPGFPQD
jgi:DNA-binding XRE family transcriptional regulator